MAAIFDVILNVFRSLVNLVQVVFWLVEGVHRLAGMMINSISFFGETLDILPTAVASSMIAVCGGLVVLRIFGRS